MEPEWLKQINKLLDDAETNRQISKEELADGLEEIASRCESMAACLREELDA